MTKKEQMIDALRRYKSATGYQPFQMARCDIIELLGLAKPVPDMELLMLADQLIDSEETNE